MYSSDELFHRSREGYFGVYFPSCEATREIDTKITLQWAQKQFVTRVPTLFYFLHDIAPIKITTKSTIFTHRPRVSLAEFAFCWWRHNGLLITLQLPDNGDAITWVVISNSLDIDFIYGDIHGRSCKIFFSYNAIDVCAWMTYNIPLFCIYNYSSRLWLYIDLADWQYHGHRFLVFCQLLAFKRLSYVQQWIHLIYRHRAPSYPRRLIESGYRQEIIFLVDVITDKCPNCSLRSRRLTYTS